MRVSDRMRQRGLLVGALALAIGLGAPSGLTGSMGSAWAQDSGVPAKKKAEAVQASTNSELEGRVAQLEEQLVDMQVVIGTLESLARGKGNVAMPATGGGALSGDAEGRMQRIELQIQSLSADIKDLNVQVQALGGHPRAAAAEANSANDPAAIVASSEPAALPGFGAADQPAVAADGSGDQIGGILGEGKIGDGKDPNAVEQQPIAEPPVADQPAAVVASNDPTVVTGDDPEKAYEDAYGFLLQQDYPHAQVAFSGFLGKFPKDKLAGNAQYWLGESHYVRGQYREAADSFLKGYSNYQRGPKAPDSLLKLAMSLSKLGQKDQSCAAFSQLDSAFPASSAQLKKRSAAERQRAGC